MPSDEEWKSWDFFQRLDRMALDVSKNGLPVPTWLIVLYHVR